MRKEHPVTMWVHPNFRKKVKAESSMNEISIIRYTKELADSMNASESLFKKKDDSSKKKKLFGDYEDAFKI